jgi:surfeit locus 1 family protein
LSNSHTHEVSPRLRPVKGRFSPTWQVTLGAMLLCALFVWLGFWQWNRGNMRQAEWSHFARGADSAFALGSTGVDEVPRFQRVTLTGRFDVEHQFLLDNRTHDGRVGYEVLTPLERPSGQVVMINRGWVAFTGHRDRLPNVAFAEPGPVTVTGRTDNLPSAGLAAGRAAPAVNGEWPKVTSYPTMSELSAALARPLEPRIVLLDPKEPEGYVRDWRPPGMQPLRHWSYAIQWWCFAIVTIVFWVVISRRSRSSGGT